MNIDEQLAELLASLGVEMEAPGTEQTMEQQQSSHQQAKSLNQRLYHVREDDQPSGGAERFMQANESDQVSLDEPMQSAEISLFQTSREHYGVFYRLDLVAAAPQLRIFAPDDENTLRMRCYLVRPAIGTPVREWFLSSRAHDGSDAYEESRETVEQHLLFAAGEALKRLFWAGDAGQMRFPTEIEVARLV